MSKRILFLISDTGGGHRASAQAIAEAMHFLHPHQYETIIEDMWRNHTPHPFREIPKAYRWVVGPGLPLWKLMWHTMSQPTLQRHILDEVEFLVRSDMQAYFRTTQPDMVVSVHPLLNQIGLNCLRDSGSHAPFVTVVTDLFTFHPTWVDPRVDRCLVPTEAARTYAIELGMAPEKIAVYGQPVSLKFAQPPGDKATLRQQLGLDADRPAVLLVGGGEGSGRLVAIARQIVQHAPHVQLLVVTGRNRALRQELAAASWAQAPHIHIYGFVNNMSELMHACDLIVTKAGPGTISEALIAGLPMILFDFIPGQETGNVAYVEHNGVGVFAPSPSEVAHTIAIWTCPGSPILNEMRANALRLARPRASLLMAEDLCHVVARPQATAKALGHSINLSTGGDSVPKFESVKENA
ncbi:MAG: glycosyltransferase [Caldilineaceae bacterium]